MKKQLDRIFGLTEEKASIKQELLAGVIGFFTVVYIIAVNSSILREAGMNYEGVALATILVSALGCLLMGFWAKLPLILMPGMGINALFTYSLVQGAGLSFEQALAVVCVSGVLFILLAFTPLARMLNEAIPLVLKQAITVGLGLFLIFLGLEKGKVIVRGSHAILELGALNDKFVLATLVTLLVTMILVIRKVPGAFLMSLLLGTGIGYLFGVNGKFTGAASLSFEPLKKVFMQMDFSGIADVAFWSGVFSLTMVVVFETVGLTFGQTRQLGHEERLGKVLQTSSVMVFLSGICGTSPTVSALESGAMSASGAKTGLASVTTGLLFLSAFFLMPFLAIIPGSAVAPILIVIGMSMVQEVREMKFENEADIFASLLIVVFIPFTYSIADGIAVGFIAYPILNAFVKRKEKVPRILYVIAALFLLQFIIQWI